MFDLTLHLGDLMVTTMLGVVSYGIKKLYHKTTTVIEQHDQALGDLEDHAMVINTHTRIFEDAGIVKGGVQIPRVVERRRLRRIISE
jgi:hypothetical protein